MNWTDIIDIAIELETLHPDIDPQWINFVDLRDKVVAIPGFVGTTDGCNERVLEAIQTAWIDERE